MSSPIYFKAEDSPQPTFSVPATHRPIPWCPSLDDQNIPRIAIPFPLTPQSLLPSLPPYFYSGSPSPTSSYDIPSGSFLPSMLSSTSRQVARPCNAFFLYRSHFLRHTVVPIKSRQQHLSRLIGKNWRAMKPADKQYWHNAATEEARKHKERYPAYKFTPRAKGKGARKSKLNKNNGRTDKEIRQIKETFTGFKGSASRSSRNRQLKKARSVEVGNQFPPTFCHPIIKVETPPSSPLSLPPQISSSMQSLSPMMMSPQPTLPHHPSASLGSDQYTNDAMLLPFIVNQGKNTSYPIYNQTMITPHPEAFQDLDSSSFPTGHFNATSWNTPTAYQQNNPFTISMTEAVSLCTVPQQAYFPTDDLSTVAQSELPQSVALNSTAPLSADDLQYSRPSYDFASAKIIASLAGMGEDEFDDFKFLIKPQNNMSYHGMEELMVASNTIYIADDPEVFANWDFIGDIDLNSVICTIGDLPQIA